MILPKSKPTPTPPRIPVMNLNSLLLSLNCQYWVMPSRPIGAINITAIKKKWNEFMVDKTGTNNNKIIPMGIPA
jgi:hypothetical protein